MRTPKNFSFRSVLVFSIALITFFAAPASAAVPQAQKVEPPNWWAGMPLNPMLLISGTGLEGARVSTSYPGVKVARVEPRPGGNYLFVWLELSPNVKPGTAKLQVSTAAGNTSFDFPILQRASAKGRYTGITEDDVLYVIMPDRFVDGDPTNDDPAVSKGFFNRAEARKYHGGDLKGVIEKLPYLKSLGVTALWLTPFWQNDDQSADYHGYHVTDMYGMEEHFGTMADYKHLVEAAHANGMKLFFDYVVNHVGPAHPWATNPPTPTWLHGTVQNHRPFSYQFQYLVDPHATRQQSRDVVEGWFPTQVKTGLPDVNVDDPQVAQYLLQNAVWWMETGGVDGLRLDTFPYSSRAFWSKFHTELFRIYPSTNTIGEVWNFDATITSFFEGGKRQWDGIDTKLPTMFDFPLFSTIRDVLVRNAPAKRIEETLRYDSLYLRPDTLVTFIGNHDTRRFMGEQGMTVAKMKAAFGLLMTTRGTPSIYAGDEIGMPGGDDPDNRRDFPGGWEGDSHNAFTAEGRTPDEQAVFSYVQQLTTLHKEHVALRRGKQWSLDAGDTYYAYLRTYQNDKVLVVFNSGTAPQTITLSTSETPLAAAKAIQPLLGAADATRDQGTVKLTVPATSVSIYEIR